MDHGSSVNKSGHSRLWLRCLFRGPQVDNFSSVSNFCNGFLNSSFNSNFFNGFFHNRFDNSLLHSFLYSSRSRSSNRLYCCNMDLVGVNTDRQLPAEDGRVMVRGVHSVVD